jgi:hypothetical protein
MERTSRFDQSLAYVPLHSPEDNCPEAVAQRRRREDTGGMAVQKQENNTGLPDRLRAGIEQLSGFSMDNVRVHRNSTEPNRWQAQAFTLGSDIFIAAGKEETLPHEAWHAVQQRQDRVRPTDFQARGVSINDDPALEREADQMGAKALRADFLGHFRESNQSTASESMERRVIQRKKVPTGFGTFATTEFKARDEGNGRRGVDITLAFDPDPGKVDAKKIALSQSIKTTTAGGLDVPLGPTQAGRMVATGKPGAGYAIDQHESTNNPIYYNTKNLGPKEELKDTPVSPPATDPKDPTKVLLATNYELGHCYKEKPADKKKKTHPAKLVDKPRSGRKGESQTFETAAFAIEGVDKNKYYGSVKWGYKVEGTDAAPIVSETDIELASTKGKPSDNFIEPAKLWNVGKTQGVLQVKTAPEVIVGKADGSGGIKLAKGTKLKQTDAILFKGGIPGIQAEVLDAKGMSTGIKVNIKTSDIEDLGGSPNKELPLPKKEKNSP